MRYIYSYIHSSRPIMPRTISEQAERLLLYLSSGVYSSEEIQTRLGLSQPSVSRLIAGLGDRVVIIGQARARRYTTRRDLRGLGGEFPVYRIDSEGNARRWKRVPQRTVGRQQELLVRIGRGQSDRAGSQVEYLNPGNSRLVVLDLDSVQRAGASLYRRDGRRKVAGFEQRRAASRCR